MGVDLRRNRDGNRACPGGDGLSGADALRPFLQSAGADEPVQRGGRYQDSGSAQSAYAGGEVSHLRLQTYGHPARDGAVPVGTGLPGTQRQRRSHGGQHAEDHLGWAEAGAGSENLVELKQELEKERVKLRDERTDYKRLIREQARRETFHEFLVDSANALNERLPLIQPQIECTETAIQPKGVARREGVLCLADWHFGMYTDNVWNKYNPDICKQRVQAVIRHTKDYLVMNKIKKLHIILLGDMANGCIHGCNIGSNKDVCDQIMEVSEMLAETINELSTMVNNVVVYTCYGNHLRTTQNKQEILPTDNMEKIIPWWLEERLKDNYKVRIEFSEYREYTLLNVVGYNIVCVHGDEFNFKDIGVVSNTIFNKMFGQDISYTISGDKHHYEDIERLGIESILVSSLCGTDNYANSLRLYGKAGQTFMVFNEEYGRESTYHIPVE
mgnify:CR=1 FL=1